MQMKYLSLALAAALATTLTACGGSDNKSNYNKDTLTPVVKPDTGNQGGSTTDQGGSTTDQGGNTGDQGGNTGKDEAEENNNGKGEGEGQGQGEGTVTPPSSGGVNLENNLSGISLGGDLTKKETTGTQNAFRTADSNFNSINDPVNGKARGTSLVTNFDQLKNTQMANIVIARTTADREEDRVAFYVGTTNNDRKDTNSLQQINGIKHDVILDKRDSSTSNNWSIITDDGDNNNGLVFVRGNPSGLPPVVGTEELQQQSKARILGVNYNTNDDAVDITGSAADKSKANDTKNTQIYDVKENQVVANPKNPSDLIENIEAIDLKRVQYGRVTNNLEDIDKKERWENFDTINGRRYQKIQTVDSINNDMIAYRNDSPTVNTYFFRGNDRTAKVPTSGNARYMGQALMYGIDNTYHGVKGGGNSNAVVTGSAGYGVGNFVEANVDFGKAKVKGSVYNVWFGVDATKPGKLVKDKLVNFEGNIHGPNSVVGAAELAYDPSNAEIPKQGDFQASFYGDKAQEMGGAFNSIKLKRTFKDQDISPNGIGEYDNVAWGGVFGAKHMGSSSGIESE